MPAYRIVREDPNKHHYVQVGWNPSEPAKPIPQPLSSCLHLYYIPSGPFWCFVLTSLLSQVRTPNPGKSPKYSSLHSSWLEPLPYSSKLARSETNCFYMNFLYWTLSYFTLSYFTLSYFTLSYFTLLDFYRRGFTRVRRLPNLLNTV